MNYCHDVLKSALHIFRLTMVFPPRTRIRLVKGLIVSTCALILCRLFFICSNVIQKVDYYQLGALWDTTYRMRLERYENHRLRGAQIGPGEGGKPVVLSSAERAVADKQLQNISLNVVASNKIAMDRSIPDNRIAE